MEQVIPWYEAAHTSVHGRLPVLRETKRRLQPPTVSSFAAILTSSASDSARIFRMT